MLWVAVFILSFVSDWLWAMYVRSATERQAWQASIYAACLVLCGALATIAFVDDHMLVIPACLGAFVGTYVAVRRKLN